MREKLTRELAQRKEYMLLHHLMGRGISDPAVLRAMGEVPREAFVPPEMAPLAYEDGPLPIGGGQTISQPYIVAYMTQELGLFEGDRVLEVGTGSGYQAAILSRIADQVYTVERLVGLATAARLRLKELGYQNITVHCGDGTLGWPHYAPYDAIMVTAGAPDLPMELLKELVPGGRLVIPVGASLHNQTLVRVRRVGDEFRREELCGVRFVPLIGADGWSD